MAQPTYYPDWATEDTTLPSTGQTNKVRPKNSLLTIGWDKGQIPSAEEFNWELNNLGQWIRYLNDEVIAGLPDVYLPKTGTQLTFQGDITGTAIWNGNAVTSVTLSSATLDAATTSATANTLVKRGSDGSTSFGRGVTVVAPTGGTSSNNNADYWLYSGTTAKGSLAWVANGDYIWLYKSSGTSIPQQEIKLYSDRIEISSPRSSSSQGTNIADLTRKDYVDTQISNLNTSLTNYINGRSTASFSQNGWWKDVNTGLIVQWGWAPSVVDDSYVTITLPTTFPTAFYSVTVTPVHSAPETDRNSIGSFANIINTSSFGAGATSDGDPSAVINGAYWIAIGR